MKFWGVVALFVGAVLLAIKKLRRRLRYQPVIEPRRRRRGWRIG